MSEPIPSVVATRILKMLALTDRVAKLSDAALSTAVIEKVWGQLNMGSEEDALLDEMIRRFDAAKGIARDENGEIDEGRSNAPLSPLADCAGYVIRFEDGSFFMKPSGKTKSLPEAARYETRMSAEDANASFGHGGTVVQVSPYPDFTQDEYDQIEQADR